MSRTYKYPREAIEDTNIKDEPDVALRIRKRLERQKHQKKMRIKRARSFKKFISFRDRQRSRA